MKPWTSWSARSIRGALVLALAALPCAPPRAADVEGELAALQSRVDADVRALRFAALDLHADELRRTRARLPDGRWQLSMMFGAMDEAMSHVVVDEADRRALEAAAADYARAHPASANAGLFVERTLMAQAWLARGRGEWPEVPADGLRRFDDLLGKAIRVLDAGRRVLAANPMWFADRIELASLAGEPLPRIDALLREGLAREPRFHAAAFAALAARSPRRGGSAAAMAAFIRDTGQSGVGARAEGLYARLVLVAREDAPHIEDDPALDWSAMTRAFDAIVASWPAPRNARRFLLMACHRGDRDAARRMLRPAALPASASAPASERELGDCAAWAQANASASAPH